jgi:DNA-binding transcriptional ArsR family regulator/DNA-binding XRE family transcriptional regulator
LPESPPFDQQWLKALTHPTRVAILRYLLEHDEASPSVLAVALGRPAGTVSYHVRRLAEAGHLVLARTTQGRGSLEHHYRLRDREATRDALRRLGLATAAPRSAVMAAASDPWERLRRALAELRRLREVQGISRDALARSLRIEASELARIERAETDPRYSTLARIAHELGTTLGEVFSIAES